MHWNTVAFPSRQLRNRNSGRQPRKSGQPQAPPNASQRSNHDADESQRAPVVSFSIRPATPPSVVSTIFLSAEVSRRPAVSVQRCWFGGGFGGWSSRTVELNRNCPRRHSINVKATLLKGIELQLANLVHRQEQVPRIIQQRPKPKLEIKASCGIIEGINFHGSNANLLGNLQRPSQGIHQ